MNSILLDMKPSNTTMSGMAHTVFTDGHRWQWANSTCVFTKIDSPGTPHKIYAFAVHHQNMELLFFFYTRWHITILTSLLYCTSIRISYMSPQTYTYGLYWYENTIFFNVECQNSYVSITHNNEYVSIYYKMHTGMVIIAHG